MKNTVCFLVALTFLAPCANSQNKNDKQFDIAYNIHEKKDTLHKNNYEVITMNMDGSNKKNITKNPDVAWTYYAYKKRLFFISDRDTCNRCFFSTRQM